MGRKVDPQASRARLKEEERLRAVDDAMSFHCSQCGFSCTKGELRKGAKKHYPRTCEKARRRKLANLAKAERASQ